VLCEKFHEGYAKVPVGAVTVDNAAAALYQMPAGTKEHKARESGDPAYHLGNVGSDDHRVHTGFGITGKMQPKINKAHETKDQTKERLNQHVLRGHDIKKPIRGEKGCSNSYICFSA
jgi:hypothetical protein